MVAVLNLTKALQQKNVAYAEAERITQAIECLLGPMEPHLYGELPGIIESAWQGFKIAAMAKHPGIKAKYDALNVSI